VLSNTLRARHVDMISLGGIIGAGLFIGSSAAIAATGPGVIFSYLLAGALCFMIMRMLGEMAIARPGAGSFVEYVRLGLGHGPGFVAGWLYWYFWVIVVGAETIAAAQIIQAWLPVPTWLLDLTLIGTLTATNLLSVKAYGECEYWFASIKVAAIIVFALLAVAHLTGLLGTSLSIPHNLLGSGGILPFGLAAMFAAVPTVMFSITGTEVATIAAAESDAPAENVARAARSVVVRVILFYVGSIFLIVCITPWQSIKVGESPFVAALTTMQVPGAATIMVGIVLTATLSCLNSGLYVISRILFELARHADAPRWLVATSRRAVPVRSILVGALLGYGFAVMSTSSPGPVFAFLLNASGTVVLFIYLLICAAQIKLRYQLQRTARQPLTFRVWWFPFLSYMTMIAIATVIVSQGISATTRKQLAASVVSLLVVVLAYRFLRRGIEPGLRPVP
jgi:GABA permease